MIIYIYKNKFKRNVGESVFMIFVTFLFAVIGAFTAKKLHLPVPYLLGAMLATGLFNIITCQAAMPSYTSGIAQIINGTVVGTMLSRDDLKVLRNIFGASILTVLLLLSYGIALGYIFSLTTPYDCMTVLFSCAPGGLVDMTLVSIDFGADISIVAIMQLSRVLFTLTVLPFVFRHVLGKLDAKHCISLKHLPQEQAKSSSSFRIDYFLFTALIGLIGGVLGHLSHFPAGKMLLAAIFSGIFSIVYQKSCMPIKARRIAQLLAGTLIGTSIDANTLLEIKFLLLPIIFLSIGYLLMDFLLTYLCSKFFHIDIVSSLFACAPGGISDMALIAMEFGANMLTILAIQTARLFGVILLYPIIVKILFT